jgi:hypothetical protein
MQEEEINSFLGHIKLMLSSLDFLGRASKILNSQILNFSMGIQKFDAA